MANFALSGAAKARIQQTVTRTVERLAALHLVADHDRYPVLRNGELWAYRRTLDGLAVESLANSVFDRSLAERIRATRDTPGMAAAPDELPWLDSAVNLLERRYDTQLPWAPVGFVAAYREAVAYTSTRAEVAHRNAHAPSGAVLPHESHMSLVEEPMSQTVLTEARRLHLPWDGEQVTEMQGFVWAAPGAADEEPTLRSSMVASRPGLNAYPVPQLTGFVAGAPLRTSLQAYVPTPRSNRETGPRTSVRSGARAGLVAGV